MQGKELMHREDILTNLYPHQQLDITDFFLRQTPHEATWVSPYRILLFGLKTKQE